MSGTPVTEAELQAHIDARLPPERAAAVAAWLTGHPEEAARIAAYRAQRDALRDALDPVIEEPLPAALDLKLWEGRPSRTWRLGRPALAASMAALIVLGGAGGWTLRDWQAPPATGTAALAREAAASYTVYARDATRPVELAGDQRPALDDWLSARLARPITAPDLSHVGLRLIGGRLLATEHGAAGFYLYRDRAGGRVALYVRPMRTVDETDRMTRREEQGVRGWTWADDGLGFGIFGTAPVDVLHDTANSVRAQYRRI